jgi:hypothetical protein
VNADGRVITEETGPYPWEGREVDTRQTNDGQFGGFFLVGKIPFTLDPQLKTPGAYMILTIMFSLEAAVQAGRESDRLRLEVLGPPGFQFRPSCLRDQGDTPMFSKCNGNMNLATLTSNSNTLQGTNILIGLGVVNPPSTPEKSQNVWTLKLFKAQDTQHSNFDQALGFEIEAMEASYKGNNQLGASTSGFITFIPNLDLAKKGRIEVIPPSNAQYRLNCAGVYKIGLPQTPVCQAKDVNQELILTLDETGLQGMAQYTFGFGVTNPGTLDDDNLNLWGVQLKNYEGATVDANMRIPGL